MSYAAEIAGRLAQNAEPIESSFRADLMTTFSSIHRNDRLPLAPSSRAQQKELVWLGLEPPPLAPSDTTPDDV
jgi:hypothetical protein